jgi:hypothetical protein
MENMAPESLLNFLWLVAAASAVMVFVCAEWRRRKSVRSTGRLRRGLALIVLLIAMLPTVSATDDIIQCQGAEAGVAAPRQVRSQGSANASGSSAFYLAQLATAFQNSRVTWPSWHVAAWRFVSLAGIPFLRSHSRFVRSHATRGPPFLSLS